MAGGVAILTAQEMAEADRLAVRAGVASLTLMESAGAVVAEEAARMAPAGGRIAVLCGPGNNGGDGFVAARHLAGAGFDVSVFALRERAAMTGDAGEMAVRWAGPVKGFDAMSPAGWSLTIDAVFGTGLTQPVREDVAGLVSRALARVDGTPRLAVDLPTGLDATTGAALSDPVRADKTVTFFRPKTGHMLLPGRWLCGALVVRDIGIPDAVLDAIGARTATNVAPAPEAVLPADDGRDVHKYARGHAVVVSGPAHRTGAARLAARGALRAGAGLVTVAADEASVPVLAAHLTAEMIEPSLNPTDFADFLAERKATAVVIGPASGSGTRTKELVEVALAAKLRVVLDADALTAFADEPDRLFQLTDAAAMRASGKVEARAVLTPHEGEFRRLFPNVTGSKLDRARGAAQRSSAIVVLKGSDTVVAAPCGRAVINDNAPVWLATAGSGDVLAGMIAGLAASPERSCFDAAIDAVWLHGDCGRRLGPGLTADDLPEQVPRVLATLLKERANAG